MVQVIQNGKYKNIQLKTFKDIPGMAPGESVKLTKGRFATSKSMEKPKVDPTGKAYIMKMWGCNALYNGEEVSFFLFDAQEAADFDAAGGVGDELEVVMTLAANPKKPGQFRERLTFRHLV